jgi:hypothetical protein
MQSPLPHNAFTSALSIQDCISSIMVDRTSELLLASSLDFSWDFEEDYGEVADSYQAYFDSVVSDVVTILGTPVFRGRWDSPDVDPWVTDFGLSDHIVDVAIWKSESIDLYVRWHWEDKEIPILVAIGAKGCSMTDEHYKLGIESAENLMLDSLASLDDDERLLGVQQLEKKGLGYFDDRAIDTEAIRLRQEELMYTYDHTQHDLVKSWILFFFMTAFIFSDRVKASVLLNITPSCGHLKMALAYISWKASRFLDAKEKVKSLYNHTDPEVRWRCALVLSGLPLNRNEDASVVRALALDSHYTARLYGVLALRKLEPFDSEDWSVLEQVVLVDDYSARAHAKELLASRTGALVEPTTPPTKTNPDA